jgi:hypothetical protein
MYQSSDWRLEGARSRARWSTLSIVTHTGEVDMFDWHSYEKRQEIIKEIEEIIRAMRRDTPRQKTRYKRVLETPKSNRSAPYKSPWQD